MKELGKAKLFLSLCFLTNENNVFYPLEYYETAFSAVNILLFNHFNIKKYSFIIRILNNSRMYEIKIYFSC